MCTTTIVSSSICHWLTRVELPSNWKLVTKRGAKVRTLISHVQHSHIKQSEKVIIVIGGNDLANGRDTVKILREYSVLLDVIKNNL